jgi:hypothetical protein
MMEASHGLGVPIETAKESEWLALDVKKNHTFFYQSKAMGNPPRSLPLGTVVARPFGQLKLALDIDACALHELVGHLDRLGIERQHRNPLCTVTVAHANRQT